jgi:colicin import membrane protein
MPAAADRVEFAPPPQPGTGRALTLALLVHLLLMMALTWGISWNRRTENVVAEAELWSTIPKQAAPPAPPPPVVQAPPLPVTPVPAPPPAPPVEATPPAPLPKPDIALEQEKRKQEAQQRQEDLQRQKKIEARKRQEALDQQKKLEARRQQEEQKKRELAEQKAAEEKKRQEDLKAAKAKAKEQEDAKRLAALRQDNLRRMQGLAGASGSPTATGTELRSSGPSAGYANRIAARIKPNIVFNDVINGNPSAEVQLRVAPDGTIVGRKLTKSSGNKSWDDAVLRAIDKTETIPRDTDGTVVPQFPITFRPHD